MAILSWSSPFPLTPTVLPPHLLCGVPNLQEEGPSGSFQFRLSLYCGPLHLLPSAAGGSFSGDGLGTDLGVQENIIMNHFIGLFTPAVSGSTLDLWAGQSSVPSHLGSVSSHFFFWFILHPLPFLSFSLCS